MKRALLAAICAAALISILPAAVSADRVTKFHDHHVSAGCDGPIEGGFAAAFFEFSAEFDSFAEVAVWLDPAIPFEAEPTMSGATGALGSLESPDEIVLTSTVTLFDVDGNEVGEATAVATLLPIGEPEIIEGDDFGNRNSHTRGFRQALEGTAELTLPDGVFTLTCFGEVSDVQVFDTNPHAFTGSSEGVVLFCSWETSDAFASLFAVDDAFGFYVDASLVDADREIVLDGSATGSLDAEGFAADLPLIDLVSGDSLSATASAVFTPIGEPVSSTFVRNTARTKTLEQALSPDGELAFSTGETFQIDDESCDAHSFDSHFVNTQPNGPKPGRPPVNDTPDGAIALEVGDRLNVQTGGTAYDAEVQVSTCDQGPRDLIANTVWYTIEGTGEPITVDTAGSNFDTLLAAFVRESDEFVEIACSDDVFFQPIGGTFQGAITFDTVAGVTYWIEAGGYLDFRSGRTETGRLRLHVS